MPRKPVVILTGASRGLGLAILEILLKAGANVVAMSRSEPAELAALVSKHDNVSVMKGDVAKDADNKAVVDFTMQMYQRIDALILNAGVLDPMGTIASLAGRLDECEQLFRINTLSIVSICSYAIPYLKASDKSSPELEKLSGSTTGSQKGDGDDNIKGRIILVSSGAATGGSHGWSQYSASKAAMNSLARTLGTEEPEIVTVSIRPGVVATKMQEQLRGQGKQHMLPKDYEKFVNYHEQNQLEPPERPGAIIAGLALKAPSSMSGQFVNYSDKEIEAYKLQ